MRDKRSKRGVVLVFAMAIIVIVTSLGVHYSATQRVSFQLAENLLLQRKARDYAEAGLLGSIAILRRDPAVTDGLTDLWAEFDELPPFDANALVILNIEDEERRLNVNSLVDRNGYMEPAFRRLFDELNVPVSLIDEIRDWTDPDDIPEPYGAENGWYRSQEDAYPSRNRPMQHLTELLLVRSMTPDIYFLLAREDEQAPPGLRNLLGVRPCNQKQININTAPREILECLSPGWSTSTLNEVMRLRQERPFANFNELLEVEGMDEVRNAGGPLDDFQDRVRFNSNYFTIKVEAVVDDYSVTLEAGYVRQGNKITYKRYL